MQSPIDTEKLIGVRRANEVHIDMHRAERARHASAFGTLNQAQLRQHHHVIVHPLDVAPQTAGELSHGKLSLALAGTDNSPTFFSKLTEKLARALKIQDLALVRVGLGRLTCNS